MTSNAENVKSLNNLYSWGIIAGMAPVLIVSPQVLNTEYAPSITIFFTALTLKKVGLL